MRGLLVWSALVMAAMARAPADVGPFGYHDRVGIPLATAVRAAEETAQVDRVFNGSPAALGQFPYFGGLVISLTSGATSACGSALVTSTRLLTAAHCWFDGRSQARLFTVVLGSVSLFAGGTRVDTASVEMHEGWASNGFNYVDDVAVISIPAVTLSENIQPVALASGSSNFAGQQAQATGIGMTGHSNPIEPNQSLAHTTVPVLSNVQCAATYSFLVTERIVCTGAGAGFSNVCTFDSGGPVTVGNTLVGLVSFGSGAGPGCQSGQPAAHSRVSAYHIWITAHL